MDLKLGVITVMSDPKGLMLSLTLSSALLITILIVLIFIFFIRKWYNKRGTNLLLKQLTLKVGGQELTFEVERNYLNLEIAHKIYIELITRKAAIPIEEDKDIIEEVYNSWYSLFNTTRDEIKSIKGELLDKPKSEKLVEMATDVLNKGLRPHLTKYQGRFRRWYNSELENSINQALSPQDIQKKFPDYDGLILSMKEVNLLLSQYAGQLKKFIYE